MVLVEDGTGRESLVQCGGKYEIDKTETSSDDNRSEYEYL